MSFDGACWLYGVVQARYSVQCSYNNCFLGLLRQKKFSRQKQNTVKRRKKTSPQTINTPLNHQPSIFLPKLDFFFLPSRRTRRWACAAACTCAHPTAADRPLWAPESADRTSAPSGGRGASAVDSWCENTTTREKKKNLKIDQKKLCLPPTIVQWNHRLVIQWVE